MSEGRFNSRGAPGRPESGQQQSESDSLLVPENAAGHDQGSPDDSRLLQTSDDKRGRMVLPWDGARVSNRPETAFMEAMRALRSQLMMRAVSAGGGRLVVPVVSAERKAGRSYIAANLAAMFAHSGARTLLIDADLRNASIRTLFGLPKSLGLAAILTGVAGAEQISAISGLPTLSVLQAGLDTSSKDLFVTNRFDALLAHIAPLYDVVIVDTTAAVMGVDAQLIAQKCNAALMVARYGKTSFSGISRLVAGLETIGVPVIGSILNRY